MALVIDDILIAVKIGSALKDLIWGSTIEAEKNPSLPDGQSKRIYVEQEAVNFVDQCDAHEHVKGEMKSLIAPSIEEAVTKFNNEGFFAKENKGDDSV